MNDKTKSATTPLLSSPSSYSAYGGNENEGIEARSQEEQGHKDRGLSLRGVFLDHTFSAAMMHSVGSLGRDEYVDNQGSIHKVTIKRRRQTIASGAPHLSNEKAIPDKVSLQDLFVQQTQEQDISGIDDKRKFVSKRPKYSGLGESETGYVEDEEFEVEDQVAGGSITAAIFGIVKATVGPAILYLPKGFQQAGWASAIPALIVSTFAYVYSAHRLLECWKVEDTRQKLLVRRMSEIQSLLEKHGTSNDAESKHNQMAEKKDGANLDAFKPKLLTYSELARRALGPFSFLIEFGIAAMQFGVCLTYLIFVPANLYASCQALFGVAIPKSYFLVGMLLIEIPCTWIRDIRRLTPFNVVATILIVYGLGSCLFISFVYSYTQKEATIFESLTSLPAVQPAWFMFIGTAFFVFEGNVTIMVPLQEAVYKKEDRERFPMVNQNVTICIVVFYVFFALSVWSTFGDHVQTALTASLPQGNFTTSVQFAYSIAVILTYPLQAYPALEVILKNQTNSSDKNFGSAIHDNTMKQNIIWCNRKFLTTLLNIGLGVIAVIAIDFLGNVVSLLGSLVGMPIALIYPPIMHNILVKDSSVTIRSMNYFVATVGLIATVVTSYATIVNWNVGAE